VTGSFAPYPGAPTPGTLFVEAFGRLSRRIGRPASLSDEGALYSIFSARADFMGWSTTPPTTSSSDVPGHARPALWSMEEAELTAGPGTARIGWVQVGLETGVEPALALPALVQCFDDALRRFGEVELDALQVTATRLQPGRGTPFRRLVSALGWFSGTSQARTEAIVAIDEGLLHGRAASELVARLQEMHRGAFEFGPLVAVPPRDVIEVPPEAPMGAHVSPAPWGVSVAMPEWTASAAAWVLALVVEATRIDGRGVPDFAIRLTRVADEHG
jgi:hypothetical protein